MAHPATPSPSEVLSASKAIGQALQGSTYAIVGGAACQLLGSTRITEDVDFVVPQGKTRDARTSLRDSGQFQIEARTLHTRHQSVGIEILAPPAMFKERFDADTPVQLIHGIKVLQTPQLLNAKCRSVTGRATNDKKQTDAADIIFLIDHLAAKGGLTAAEKLQVPNATVEFIRWFDVTFEEARWAAAGLIDL